MVCAGTFPASSHHLSRSIDAAPFHFNLQQAVLEKPAEAPASPTPAQAPRRRPLRAAAARFLAQTRRGSSNSVSVGGIHSADPAAAAAAELGRGGLAEGGRGARTREGGMELDDEEEGRARRR